MSELEQDINRHYRLKYHNLVKGYWCKLATGGGRIVVNRHIINYRERKNPDESSDIVFLAGRDKKKRPCFTLKITNDGEAILESIDRRKDCFVDDHDNSKDLVRAAVQLAKNRKAVSFQFQDNSFIQCPDKITLSDLYFLTTDKTWYESFLDIEPVKSVDGILLEKFRKIVRKNSWSSVLNNIFTNFNENYKDINFDITGIDINADGSAMEVMNRAKMSKKHCTTFSNYMPILLFCSNITTLKSISWFSKDFSKPKNLLE